MGLQVLDHRLIYYVIGLITKPYIMLILVLTEDKVSTHAALRAARIKSYVYLRQYDLIIDLNPVCITRSLN